MKNFLLIAIVALAILFFSSAGFYTYWNNAAPVNTCASCHEISPSVGTWQHSAHRDVSCFECHGTALSNGIHSLKEKSNMVFTHITEEKYSDEIRLNESQVLDMTERCAKCHQSEFVKWNSGRHSNTYSDIFLDSIHNSEERLYWDCFRCHGMYYEGNIYDLVSPINKKGPWQLKDSNKGTQHTMPCLSCHQMHTDNTTILSGETHRNPPASLYVRSDKMFLRADLLPKVKMENDGNKVKISEDPIQSLCVQCHSPNAVHATGSSDDRTPTGVHEGLSCLSCHDPHSNDASESCVTCHQAISNCNLDVRTMNTSYADAGSSNNIHFVSCADCHDQ